MKAFAAALFVLLPFCAAAADAPATVDAALQQATRERRPLLLDFEAQWCHSCYYMAAHVLTGPRWQAVAQRARVFTLDGDSTEGARWTRKLNVKAFPTFVVLKPDGTELGRIVAEHPPAPFFARLERILAGDDALDGLQRKARAGSQAAVADALAVFDARGEIDAGLAWYAALPQPVRQAAAADAHSRLWHERLRMQRAAKTGDHTTCIAAAQRVLAGDIGCDRYYALQTLQSCAERVAPARRRLVLARQRPALVASLDHDVFVDAPACADQRAAVLAAADIDEALGDDDAAEAVLERAIAFDRARLGGDYAKDRNLTDNLRVFLERAGRTAEHDALLDKLIAAHPDDYVDAWHMGTSLLERGEPARALPYLEQAAPKAFGANHLYVTMARVSALLALNRRAEAERVAADALAASGPGFDDVAAKLKALLKT